MAESDGFGNDGRQRRGQVDSLPIAGIGDDRIERTRSWTLDHTKDYISIFAYAAYARMALVTPVAGPDITAAFQNIDFYDAEPLSPRGIATDLVNGTFAFSLTGVYAMSFTYALEHDEVNNARDMIFRVFDVTDDVPVSTLGLIIGTARNQNVTFASSTILFEVDVNNEGDVFVVQVGGAAGSPVGIYSSVQWDSSSISLWNVGEFRGLLTGSAGGLATLRDL